MKTAVLTQLFRNISSEILEPYPRNGTVMGFVKMHIILVFFNKKININLKWDLLFLIS